MSHSVRLAALALVGALLPLLAAADEPTEADPLPLRRVLIPPARVAAELERARQGILVKLPRAEFEARVRQAARTGEPAENVPRLVRAAYTARLKETALVGGGDWTIVNPTAGSAVLPLPDFNLALSKITLDDPTALTVLGDLDGKTLGLLATRTGKQSVFFDWSLQGSQAGPELHFDLQVPASPIASLELTVPADRTVAVSRGVALISGPHETAEKDQREWRLQFAGRTRVEFVVRPLGAAGRLPPLLLAQLTTTQQLAPQSLQARYEFQVEALHGGVRKLTFDYDPPLEPYDVTTDRAELQGWSLDRKNRTLTVQLGESEESLRLTVLCEAPLFQDKKDRVWISPGIRLREAAAHSETLLLQANADVRLENWSAGLFRLIKSGVAPDGGQLLTLVDGGAPARYAERPSAALKVHGADVSARQRTWWQVGPGGSTLTVEVTYEVASGTLMKLPLRTTAEWANPPWEVEEVRLEPKGLLGPWSPTLSKGMLVVELQQALTAGERATLTVKLRSPRERVVPGSDSLLPLPFPDLEPLNVRLREGMLAIDVDPRYQASVLKASHELTPPEKGGPWGDVLPNYAYLFKGKSVTGQLRLTLHRPRASARSSTEVSLAPDRGTLFVRLQLEPAVGSPTSVDVELSAPTAGLAKWRSEGAPNLIREAQRQVHIETAQRVLALGPWNPPEIAALLAAAPVREHWHLTFARPLTQRETIILEAALPAPLGAAGEARGERRWDVPLLTVRGADRMEGEVALHLLGLDLLRADAEAVQESNRNTAPAGGGRNAVPSRQESWRFFRYGRALFPGRLPALRVSGKVLGADAALRLDRSPREVCDRSRLTTYVEPRGRLLHHYRFRLWNWRQTTLPVLLPPGMKLLAAKAEGRWLDHLEQRLTPEGRTEVSLPVASGTAPHRFELVYAADDVWPSWAPWARLTAPVPELPVLPTSFYRTWRLPPGVTPLTASVRRLPDPLGPHDPESWWAPVRHAWRAGHPWLTTVAPELFPDGSIGAQQQFLADAEDALRQGRPAGKPWRFGEALERLTFRHLKQSAIVVDAAALRAEGIRPSLDFLPAARAARPGTQTCLFEGLGLAYFSCRPATLLTTRRQVISWQAVGVEEPAGGALDQALAEAVAYGRDSSGRFQSVAYWLARQESGEGAPPPLDSAYGPPLPGADSFGATWTEWESVAGTGADDVLLLVRQGGVRALGLTLAGLFCLLAWRSRLSLPRRWRARLLTLWVAAAGLALFWLPPALADAAWWPALAGCAAALVAYLAPGKQAGEARSDRSNHSRSGQLLLAGTASAILALLLIVPSTAAHAFQAAQEPYLVLLLPAEPPEAESVLVSPDLLKKLDELSRRAKPLPRGPVLLSAEYTGQIVHDRAEITAKFQVYCPADDGVLTVPLGGVELRTGSMWAGQRVYPDVAPTGQPGYTVRLQRSGPHPINTLRLSFSVRLPATSDARELRFTIPRLPQSQLILSLPAKTQTAQVASGLGRQTFQTVDGPRLEADVGRTGAVLVRWHGQPPKNPPQQVLELQEYYFWDLHSPSSPLTAVWRYTVKAGSVSSFLVNLPQGVEVRSVDVAQVGVAPTGSPPARLKGMQLLPAGPRRIKVDLYAPATGEVQMTLGLVPRLAVRPGELKLRLPTPPGNVKVLKSLLAYRVEGLGSSGKPLNLDVAPIEPKMFVQAWQGLGMRTAVQPTHAYTGARGKGQAAVELTLVPLRVVAGQEVTWHVHPQHADFEAVLQAKAAANLLLLEWDIPPQVSVSRVLGEAGTRVRSWSVSGGRLQVWLAQPVEKAAVRVEGWTAYPRSPAKREGRFVLPCLRLLSAEASPNVVRVAASPELLIAPERETQFQGLRRLPERDGELPLSYLVAEPSYRGEFVFRDSPVVPQVRSLTSAEVRDGTLTCTAYLDLRVPYGELRTVTVRVRNWAEAVRLDAPGAVQGREQRGAGGERSWVLPLPPGMTRQYAVRVILTAPLQAGDRRAMPEVSVDGSGSRERWLAVLGPGVRAEGVQGLAPVKAPVAELQPWPAEAERVRREGAAWKVTGKQGGLLLTQRPTEAAPSVQVLYVEQHAAVTDLRQWAHQATYWLTAGSATDLEVILPRGARVAAAAVDGVPVSPRPAERGMLLLPLSGAETVRVLRLRWLFEDGVELLEAPNLEMPRFKESPEAPMLWRVDVPAGYRFGRGDPEAQGRPVGTAAAELGRADAQLRISALLAERLRAAPSDATRAQLLAAQQAFFRHWNRAANLLTLPGPAVAGAGPARQSLPDWLRDLRQHNAQLGRGTEVERIRALAERQPGGAGTEEAPALFALPERGLPTYWFATVSGESPRLQLAALTNDRRGDAILSTELLGVVLVGGWIIAYLPALLMWLRRLLPEQLALLAWLGWSAFGFSLLGGLLLVTAVCARVVLLGSWVGRWLRPARPESASGSNLTPA